MDAEHWTQNKGTSQPLQAAETNECTGPLEQSPMCASWSARALVRLPSVLMDDRRSQLTPPHRSEDALVSERGKLCE